jgi:hypothetical protein
MIGYEWHDLVGNIGVFCILVTYLMLQLEKILVTSFLYSGLNALGAGMVVFSLLYDFNLSAFVIESAWLLISLLGIARRVILEPGR